MIDKNQNWTITTFPMRFYTKNISILIFLVGFCGNSILAQKLFTKLQASKTGIDFENRIEDKKEHNILIYSNYYGGAGVGIGDLNNDGLQDIFFAGNLVEDKLYLNQGNLSFKDISESSGIIQDNDWSTSVVMADVNSDGWLDIYVTRELYDDAPGRRRNLLYINQKAAKSPQFKELAGNGALKILQEPDMPHSLIMIKMVIWTFFFLISLQIQAIILL